MTDWEQSGQGQGEICKIQQLFLSSKPTLIFSKYSQESGGGFSGASLPVSNQKRHPLLLFQTAHQALTMPGMEMQPQRQPSSVFIFCSQGGLVTFMERCHLGQDCCGWRRATVLPGIFTVYRKPRCDGPSAVMPMLKQLVFIYNNT